MFFFFLPFILHSLKTVATSDTLDVCSSCHINATCDPRKDGTGGKMCNCLWGFMGNGRTQCIDKDECQIGTHKICGEHTVCHNTYGSFYCTCQHGYSPTNNMPVFIPNDGTFCQDIDECQVEGICKDGGLCWNVPGSFSCNCSEGYKIRNGTEPFHPAKDGAFCEEIDCGEPPVLPHAIQLWNGSTRLGSVVYYECDEGFYNAGERNFSVCDLNGYWNHTSIVCKEIDCSEPPVVPNTTRLWHGNSGLGSEVYYNCTEGFHSVGGRGVSVCTANGYWTHVSLLCKGIQIDCGQPPVLPHTVIEGNSSTGLGSTVYYNCKEGFHSMGGRNVSVCTVNGLWENASIVCKDCSHSLYSGQKLSEIDCGDPPILPHTTIQWDTDRGPGSAVYYSCTEGFYKAEGLNISTCTLTVRNFAGLKNSWYLPYTFLTCSHRMGFLLTLVLFICNSKTSWQTRKPDVFPLSFHNITFKINCEHDVLETLELLFYYMTEKKPAISRILIFKEKCLQWQAERNGQEKEIYKVHYIGLRDYQKQFVDKKTKHFTSAKTSAEICLNLLPGTNYTINITALSAGFSSTVNLTTSIGDPPIPKLTYKDVEGPLPTLQLHKTANSNDPISFYQVFVLPLEGFSMFDCSSPSAPHFYSQDKPWGAYVAAQIHAKDIGSELVFTVGDRRYYGEYYNAPLKEGTSYYIILKIVTQWGRARKQSCVFWAKTRELSHTIQHVTIVAGGSVGLIAFVVFLGFSISWYFKKK
uniref:Sushi domain containing 1 n=1 Tax=Lepisosteus oculatus TaxID=7918 RepID=W5M530_LEPOC